MADGTSRPDWLPRGIADLFEPFLAICVGPRPKSLRASTDPPPRSPSRSDSSAEPEAEPGLRVVRVRVPASALLGQSLRMRTTAGDFEFDVPPEVGGKTVAVALPLPATASDPLIRFMWLDDVEVAVPGRVVLPSQGSPRAPGPHEFVLRGFASVGGPEPSGALPEASVGLDVLAAAGRSLRSMSRRVSRSVSRSVSQSLAAANGPASGRGAPPAPAAAEEPPGADAAGGARSGGAGSAGPS